MKIAWGPATNANCKNGAETTANVHMKCNDKLGGIFWVSANKTTYEETSAA